MLLSCNKTNHIEPSSMKRMVPEENSETKRTFYKQESISFGYDVTSYANYSTSSTPSPIAQPLPGQPPLPPPSGVPPPPHVFGPVPSQVTPIQAWPHAPTQWQWMAPQTSPLPPPTPHDITNTIQRDIQLRDNYVRRDRFHNRNNMYVQRNNFHRKNRRLVRYGQSQGQFDQAAYFGATLAGNLGLDWRRNNYAAAANDAIINHMTVPLPNHPIPPIPAGIASNRHGEEMEDQDVKIEKVVKKNKQRKPMSQSYVTKPWNREDAERALKIENEYNMKNKVNAQSLILKFPDTELNKDIVRLFHPGILNIHFQNPCGPRYCFIQMAEDVNIDEAINDLEKKGFGVGHVKVEKKSVREEDNPEEIDPYTLFIGNLPEFVKTSEIKSKFPKAQDEEMRKMKNTRNVLMRYNSVDDAISDYKQAYGLMWDKRCINVRFRRKRVSEEPKSDVKKVKEEPNNAAQAEKERNANHIELELGVDKLKEEENNTDETKEDKIGRADKSITSAGQDLDSTEARLQDSSNEAQSKSTSLEVQETNSHSSALSTLITSAKTTQEEQRQPWTSQPPQISSASEAAPSSSTEAGTAEETVMLTQIKEEPIDYDEYVQSEDDTDDDVDDDDVDDDDDDVDDDDDDDDDDNADDAAAAPTAAAAAAADNDYDTEETDDTDDYEDNNAEDFEKDDEVSAAKRSRTAENNEEESDHLDPIFSHLYKSNDEAVPGNSE